MLVSDSDDDDLFNSLGTTNQNYDNRENHVRCKYPFTNHNKLRNSKKRKRRGHQNCYLCETKRNKYKVTCYYCAECRLPLCNKGCFDHYHEQIFLEELNKVLHVIRLMLHSESFGWLEDICTSLSPLLSVLVFNYCFLSLFIDKKKKNVFILHITEMNKII